MSIAANIKQKIDEMDAGEIFYYEDLSILPNEFLAASKVLSRLVQQGVINRYKKGVFYKPKQTIFGEIKPREEAFIEKYLFENKKQVAYITGNRLYNQMGLTTQVPNEIRVASNNKKISTKIGGLTLKPAKSYIPVTRKNVPLLQLLDVIKDFKIIPDLNKSKGLEFLKNKITLLSETDKKKLVDFAKKYPPKVRALLGAILESLSFFQFSTPLKNHINSLSSYEFGLTPKHLPTIGNWNVN